MGERQALGADAMIDERKGGLYWTKEIKTSIIFVSLCERTRIVCFYLRDRSTFGEVLTAGGYIYTAHHVVYNFMKIRGVEWNDRARKGFRSNTKNDIFMLHGVRL